MDISRTIPQIEKRSYIDNLFDGSWKEADVPFGQRIKNVHPGDHLYLIYRGRFHGRLEITAVDQTPQTVQVGTANKPVTATTVVWVKCPGELAPNGLPPCKGHRNHRYIQHPIW